MFSLLAQAVPAEETTQTVTTTFQTSTDALRDSFTKAYNEIVARAPEVLAVIALLVVGYVVARLVARVVTILSDKIGLQTAADRSGLSESMTHMGIRRNVPAILGTICFWLLMCLFLMTAFNILHLTALTEAMGSVVNYSPRLIVAAVVVVVGLLVASFIRGVVATSADRVGISYAQHLANGCYYVLAMFTFIAAFDQLNIQFALLNNLILIAFGALAVGFGLSFGLGGRDVMAGILAGYYLRQRLHAGDTVLVCGMSGTVREVGPVATIIETDEEGLLNRHSVPNTRMLNEAVR
jgi:hypothetical protein